MKIGYARVSTTEQDLTAQRHARSLTRFPRHIGCGDHAAVVTAA